MYLLYFVLLDWIKQWIDRDYLSLPQQKKNKMLQTKQTPQILQTMQSMKSMQTMQTLQTMQTTQTMQTMQKGNSLLYAISCAHT